MFNPATTAYDPQNAFWFGQAANLAYEKKEAVLKSSLVKWGFDRSRIVAAPSSGTQAFVAGNAAMVMVTFRGTEPDKIKDWMTDLHCSLVDGPGGKVHAGFSCAVKSVWNDITAAIAEYQDQGQSLWFTGHSLGAALATLAVAKLRLDMDKPVYGLYTFGSPRVGDRTFAQNFDAIFKDKTFRFVNNNDIVTRIPPRELLYSHIGTFVYFDHDGQIQTDIGFWYKFLDRVQGTFESFVDKTHVPDAIADHLMKNYLMHLQANQNNNPF